MGEKMTAVSLRQQMKAEQWSRLVTECRSSGLSVTEWCEQQGINNKTYYRWEHRLLEMVNSQSNANVAGRFIKLPATEHEPLPTEPAHPSAILRVGSLSCGIHEGISPELLQMLVRAMKDNA